MNIHEYQAKELLAKYGVAVPRGGVAYTAAEAVAVARRLGGRGLGGQGADPCRRPRQGRRGQARSRSEDEVAAAAARMLGHAPRHPPDRAGRAARSSASMSRRAATSPASFTWRC